MMAHAVTDAVLGDTIKETLNGERSQVLYLHTTEKLAQTVRLSDLSVLSVRLYVVLTIEEPWSSIPSKGRIFFFTAKQISTQWN